jgi:hypothetical protein
MNTTSNSACERQVVRRAANAANICDPLLLKALQRHFEHRRLRVKKREMACRESVRDGRAEKTGPATDFEHAIHR